MVFRAACIVAVLLLSATPQAQDATLDVLDGETLYEGGWLVTVSRETETRSELRSGGDQVEDPLRQRASYRDMAVAAHYGLRHDLQLSMVVPYVNRSLRIHPQGAPAQRLSVEGMGDLVLLAKWRFYRWEAPGKALNVSLISGLEVPTGEDDATDDGLMLPADLQPGKGTWNPMLGVAATYEPERWRFNAVALYMQGGSGGEFETSNEFFSELSVGNRFWLEPYPGPFMRADLALRYRRSSRVHYADGFVAGPPLANDTSRDASGGDLTTLAFNVAFRPRPSLDLQLEVETPLSQNVHGTDLGAGTTVSFNVGVRF